MANSEFTDLLSERRKDWDILWVSRPMNPLTPHKLPPDVTYTRKQMIEAVLTDPKVLRTIETLASSQQVPQVVIVTEARAMLQEMASKAHLPTVRWLGLLITKVIKRILLTIRINESQLLSIKNQMSLVQVQYIYAPSHRSYLDFVLLSYILFSYDMALPNIASGMDFYRMKVVGELLRHTGAFYMRRTFSTDPLYKEIFRSYVNLLVAHSDRAIEFFIEGTRSRSQKSLAPKFGLLSTILDSLYRSQVPDIQFIPISISYDRPLEELLFAYELLGVPKPAESTSGLFRSLSILCESFSHGHVYFHIAEPISASEYMNLPTRQASALSPSAKLPMDITKNVAYSIIESHKQHTILTAFNLIALMYNERIHSCPEAEYTLDSLYLDYRWIKQLLVEKFNAIVCPRETNETNSEKDEILESLHTHKDLLVVDESTNELKLKERHIGGNHQQVVKGHILQEETLRIAVPIINLIIYTNPVFAYLAKPALAALSIGDDCVTKVQAAERYFLLRALLSTEFAFDLEMNQAIVKPEWENLFSMLLEQNCVSFVSNGIVLNKSSRLSSLLCNLLVPYILALRITCMVLAEWLENSGEPTEKNIMTECQRISEDSLFNDDTIVKHPYSLSLDLYATSLTSLVAYGVVGYEKPGFYYGNKIRLASIVASLNSILPRHTTGSYMHVAFSLAPSVTNANLQAKL